MKKVFLMAVSAAALLFAQGAKAQTNLQVFYDFGPDRQHVTTTLEGFYNDNWGNTFFFIDHDFNSKVDGKVVAPSGTYWEIARCFNFWQDSALAPLSFQFEYNGGVYNGYTINNAFLLGLDWFLHSDDFNNTFNFKVLYKNIARATQQAPLQFTFVWGLQDLFGVKGLRFSGFADFWWEDHSSSPTMTAPSCRRRPTPCSSPSPSSGTTSASTSAATTSTSAASSSSPTISVPPRVSGAVPAPVSSGSSSPRGSWLIS